MVAFAKDPILILAFEAAKLQIGLMILAKKDFYDFFYNISFQTKLYQ